MEEETPLLPTEKPPPPPPPPSDYYNIAYIIYFTLGTGYLLPWNAFITAVDYFTYLYPNHSIDRTFSVVCQPVMLVSLVMIIFFLMPRWSGRIRVNFGLVVFVLCLVVVPCLDGVVGGRRGVEWGYYVTVGAVGGAGLANGFVQGSLIGSAGELPERYMQAVVAGTAASGVLVSALRIFTKAVYPQDYTGLRNSAILYFAVAITLMVICIILYNIAHTLPVIRHYNDLKTHELEQQNDKHNGETPLSGPVWETMSRIKWLGIGILLIYIVTLSIFPGFITEDVHSDALGDWYPVLLITAFNVFDLIGKGLTAVYLLGNDNIVLGACFTRLVFYPLYLGCLNGPGFFRTEIPVTGLTCLLGLSNGYLTSVLMILGPKRVRFEHKEMAGVLIALFLISGLAAGSVVSWFLVV